MKTENSQVQILREEIAKTSRAAEQLWNKHSVEQLLRRPGEKKWSAAECVVHLNLSNRAYTPRIQEAIEQLQQLGWNGTGPFSMEWNARLLKWWLEPPSWLRLPTGAPFLPVPIANAAEVLLDFVEINSELMEQLESGKALALDRYKINSPFAAGMKYNVYSAFTLIAAHNRRHLWQAARAIGS